ncbi:hypothetical protein BC830DRAFT_1244906 [Chytriomyces sp. MP71]|nr:hypothetical protein BC830DRAFT_1244906 [Chytriomyces sp. MP71]
MTLVIKHNHRQHEGELTVQRLRKSPQHLPEVLENQIIQDEMPVQHSTFFATLKYLAIGVLDHNGRPWITLVSGKPGFVTAPNQLTLGVRADIASTDPVALCFAGPRAVASALPLRPWAGVGVDYANRRRNKVAGYVETAQSEGGAIHLTLVANQNMGNCPKYITVRDLISVERSPETVVDEPSATSVIFSEEERALINRCSTIYIAAPHITGDNSTTDVGVNHRGGPKGFVRVLREQGADVLIIPDYSGNRFYQTLGNVQSDKLAGVVFVCFETGDMLHLTGHAENIFDAQAEHIMPRVSLVTKLSITGRVFIKDSLKLGLRGPEQLSPYNPPLRLLRQEMEATGKSIVDMDGTNMATLVAVEKLSDRISTFTFSLDKPVNFLPGSYAVFDFSSVFEKQYQHMNQANPKLVNDDLVRTWTISSSPQTADKKFLPTTRITCTIKRVDGGLMSSFLHSVDIKRADLKVRLAGIGGGFTCFSKDPVVTVPQKLLFIAAGVGVTPFMAMMDGLRTTGLFSGTNVHVLFSARGNESQIAVSQFKGAGKVDVFDSSAREDSHLSSIMALHCRRISRKDIEAVDDLLDRDIFLCGTMEFMNMIQAWLKEGGVDMDRVHRDSFDF